jgi:hypothetical protein
VKPAVVQTINPAGAPLPEPARLEKAPLRDGAHWTALTRHLLAIYSPLSILPWGAAGLCARLRGQ